MDEDVKQGLIEEFAACLNELDPEDLEAQETDAYSVMAEVVALKTEVKTESRQVKEALDQFREVFATLQASQTSLGAELDRRRGDEKRRERELLRPLLLQLLDLHDRLEAGLEAMAAAPTGSGWLESFLKKDERRLAAIRQGQEMTLTRLLDILYGQQVRPLVAEGSLLDPHAMRAVESESHQDLPEGMVLAELRKGFLWGDTVLRPAEVRVNKRP